MSYATTHKGPDPKAMAAATAIQIGIGALVITGLSAGYGPLVDETERNLPTVFYDPPEPTPPPPQPTASAEPTKRSSTTVYRPDTRTDIPATATGVPTTDEIPLDDSWFAVPGPTASGTSAVEQPTPSPKPVFTPVDPVPSSPPTSWFSTADYPSISARRGEEGTVGYRLQIGANGKVESCTVTRSSGHSALDRATCRLLPRRGAFSPARDDTGAKVKGTFSAEILWQLP